MTSISFHFKQAAKYAYAFVPLKVRLGKKFFQELKVLEERQWWSSVELENYQNEQLRKLIKHAYENVAYYHNSFRARKLLPSDIRSLKDLPKLPILTKDIVRNNLNRLLARNFSLRDTIKLNTSGTTGEPLYFFYNPMRGSARIGFQSPFLWRQYRWGGHQVYNSRASLSCWTIPGQKNVFYNPLNNVLVLSAYALKYETAKEYAGVLKKYDIRFMDGYPSSIDLFSNFLRSQNIPRPVELKAIYCFAEFLYDWQKRNIEDYWGCKCFNRYGLNERVIWGMDCEKHEGLHLIMDFGISEFLDDKVSGYNRIIATGFTNYAMPFIRYDTGDFGRLLERKCSCSRGFPIFEISGGRTRNFAIGKDGSYIPIANIDIPNVSENVKQFQFIQNRKGELILKIIKKDNFGERDMRNINLKLREKFANTMSVNIEFVDKIFQTKAHKTPIFIQNLEGNQKACEETYDKSNAENK